MRSADKLPRIRNGNEHLGGSVTARRRVGPVRARIPAPLSRLRADPRLVRRGAFPLLAVIEGALQISAQSSVRLSPSNFR